MQTFLNFETVGLAALAMAAMPCGLVWANMASYRRLPKRKKSGDARVSVLIPARNEEANLPTTLQAVLANPGGQMEVILLDDHSTDRTRQIAEKFAQQDSRLKLETAPPLPQGWCGKQHACHVLSRLARNPWLVFIDADVHLAPDALGRMIDFMESSGADLASGVPRQVMGTFSERLLLPLIHFILLGYLPMFLMRRVSWPGLSAGCGQLFVVKRSAYEATGGHAMIPRTLHDGLKLPRLFRQHGYRTELFDATDLASCRMYHTNFETWRGLGKNATEGLAAPGTILPMTLLLLGAAVLPLFVLLFAPLMGRTELAVALLACLLSFAPRWIACWKFRQPLGSAMLHPVGIVALLVIQWWALARKIAGRPAVWKGRSYPAASTAQPASVL